MSFRGGPPGLISKENMVPYVVLFILWIFFIGSILIYSDVVPYPDLPIDTRVSILSPLSFFLFLIIFYFSLVLFRKTNAGVSRKRILYNEVLCRNNAGNYFSSCRSLFFLALMLIFSLFLLWFNLYYSGGIDVIKGDIGRGLYRRQELGLGPLASLFKNYMPKSILSASVFVFFSSKYRFLHSFFLLVVALSTGLIALSTGFKGSLIFYFAPAATVFVFVKFKSFRFYHIFFLFALAMAFALGATLILFDEASSLIELLFHRIFAIPVAVPVRFAENYFYTGAFSEYFPTLFYILGGTLVAIIVSGNHHDIVDLNFSWKITNLSGYDVSSIVQGGHTNTATVIGEALFMAGFVGIILFAVFCAFLSLAVSRVMLFASVSKQGALLTVLSVYVWNNFVPWVN
mgnify:CR=1 FL=1